MKKSIITFLVLLMTLLLTACKDLTPTVDLHVYNYYHDLRSTYSMTRLHEPTLIQSYEAYEGILFSTDKEPLYENDYFDDNSIYIVPVVNHKEPTFELKDFRIEQDVIEVVVNQNNSFYRTSSLYWENTYYLIIEIDSHNYDDVHVEVFEKDDYFDQVFYIESESLGLSETYTITFNYEDFVALYDGPTIVDEKTYEDHFVILFQVPYLRNGNEPFPIDLTYNETYDTITYNYEIIGDSASLVPQFPFCILIIDKYDDITEDTTVKLYEAEFIIK